MTKLQLLATILALVVMALLSACSKEDYTEPDIFKVTPELRARINDGMRMVSRSDRNTFDEKFNVFLYKCDEMGLDNTPYQYMQTEEYADLKEYLLSASPANCYLLMDRYLKRNPEFFSFILNDLIDSAWPEAADQIVERLKSPITVRESMELYPQVCLEIWMDAIENR
jgi:hypothetical protein